ncbi:hypothetical protein AXG93_3384s1270 [Marchantia polymorpha subsp. ruderalis]|uniref:Uncharacterized protein n=1 Tax=Marchantia polymorpha subsp. ruderalis TaxID=1480154 RepID=A0A176WGA9_MARPO|nr:hypothetical protein AXG93_3384s1270 [Marchantia polymorpha subsp. ruderalis]
MSLDAQGSVSKPEEASSSILLIYAALPSCLAACLESGFLSKGICLSAQSSTFDADIEHLRRKLNRNEPKVGLRSTYEAQDLKNSDSLPKCDF